MTQLPRSVHRHHFLVKINKEKQRKKREQLADGSSLVAHTTHVFLSRNQQCGEIVRIGNSPYPAPYVTHITNPDGNRVRIADPYFDYSAAEYLPEAWLGDTLIFHHSIEGSMDDRGGGDKVQDYHNTKHLLFEDEENRYYLVHKEQVYAVDKLDGSGIYMAPNWLFCDKYVPEAEVEVETINDNGRELVETGGGLLLFNNYKPTVAEQRQKLATLENDIKHLSRSGVDVKDTNTEAQNKRAAEVRASIMEKQREMGLITRSLTAKSAKLYVSLHPNRTFNKDCSVDIDQSWLIAYNQIGDSVVQVNYNGKEYCILKTSQVQYIQKKF